MVLRFVIIGISVLAIWISAAAAETISGSPIIIDADTLEIGETRIRIHGIDAPEVSQKCNSKSVKSWSCGKEAVAAMENLVSGRSVTCIGNEWDTYGRLIAVCKTGNTDIGAQLVSDGMAWAFVKYSRDYAAQEIDARKRKVGVFQAENQTPWDFRAERWAEAQQQSPKGCPIKGNISRNGRIYHPPWSPWYSRTKINTSKGERWFCDEAEAIAAGWRAPRWGRK